MNDLKIYIQPKGITLVGKAWQINYMLKKYMKNYTTVTEWIDSQSKQNTQN